MFTKVYTSITPYKKPELKKSFYFHILRWTSFLMIPLRTLYDYYYIDRPNCLNKKKRIWLYGSSTFKRGRNNNHRNTEILELIMYKHSESAFWILQTSRNQAAPISDKELEKHQKCGRFSKNKKIFFLSSKSRWLKKQIEPLKIWHEPIHKHLKSFVCP